MAYKNRTEWEIFYTKYPMFLYSDPWGEYLKDGILPLCIINWGKGDYNYLKKFQVLE